MSLISGVPVIAMSRGRAVRARIRSERASTFWDRCEPLVLDEVRLVDDHAAQPEVTEPADVAVEDLVVDDDDVGEGVDLLAVAVDDRDRPVRGPEPGLAGPVGLDHVGDDDQQRERLGGLGGEQRLGGLAEAGLVGEQERAVPVGGGRDDLRLVRHQLVLARRLERAGLGQRHAADRAGRRALEGAEQRADQLPGREATRLGGAVLARR